MLPSVLFIGLSNITGLQILVPRGFENKVMIAIGTGAIFNIAVNFLLIPSLDVSGAAIATVLSDILALGIEFIMLKDMLIPIIKKSLKNNAKIFISLAISTAIAYFVGGYIFVGNETTLFCLIRLVITFTIFCVVYFIGLLITKETFIKEVILPMILKVFNKIFRRKKAE